MKKSFFYLFAIMSLLWSENTMAQCPGGDTPNDAIMINSTPYHTTGRTDTCYTDTRNNSSADVFYQMVVGANTDSLMIETCGSGYDSYLRVFASDTITPLYQNDDKCGTQAALYIDVTGSTSLNIGDTIFIMIEGYASNNGSYVLDVNEVALPTCPNTSALMATNIMMTSVDLAWTENGSANTWEVMYDTAGFMAGMGNSVLATTNPRNITGLMGSTAYEFYVRAICGAGDTSAWTGPMSFTTSCATMTAPFLESFASASLPSCWSEGGVNSWEYGSTNGTTPTGFAAYGAANVADHSTGGMGTFIGMDGSNNNNGEVSTLLSPMVDVSALTNGRLNYWVFSNNTSDSTLNKMIVELYDGANWNVVDSIEGNLGNQWVEFSTSLSGMTITGAVQVRFTVTAAATGNAFYNDILIDDVAFNNAPTCPNTSALMATNVTATSADLGWTENGAATTWEIMYDTAGFTVGMGNSVLATTNPRNITGLMSNSAYEFYVRAICGAGDTSAWTGPMSFNTTLSCPNTSALMATNVTATSADLGWTENGAATTWEIMYDTAGFTVGMGNSVLATTNPRNITGLMSNSTYDFYVRAICGAGDTSAWTGPVSFNTLCTGITGDTPNDAIMVGALPYSDARNTGTCYTDTRNNTSADVFYQMVVPSTTCVDTLSISLCGSAYDTYLRVFASDTTTELHFNDDDCSLQSQINISLVNDTTIHAGDTLFIMVEGYSSRQGAYNLNITLNDLVQTTAVDNGGSSVSATSIGGTMPYTYAWSNGLTGDTVMITANGIYTVTATDANGCTGMDSVNAVIIGTETIANISSLNMFPNPTSGNVFVELNLVETANVSINIFNVTGQSVMSRNLGNTQTSQVELATTQLATGVYLVKINIGNEIVTRKLIISKQ